MNEKKGIFWLREDFRLQKNPALSFAAKNHNEVVVIYLFKKKDFENKREAQRWWVFKSLSNFQKELKEFKINLEVVITNSYKETFEKILKQEDFSIYWNKVYEPKFLKFDNLISKELKKKKIEYKIFKGNILNEEGEVKKSDKTPFKVFTPFWKTAEKIYLDKGFIKNIEIEKKSKESSFFKSIKKIEDLLPNKKWYLKFEQYWNPSEKEAQKKIQEFIKDRIFDYGDKRDVPGISGTSKISPYLALGQINVETIWEECEKLEIKQKGYRKFINELGWREFSHSLINYFPEMLVGNLRKEFDNFPWEENKKNLNIWKKGLTGYPIVDAGMRELCETGWMHNRVRMITASFLVKHLRIHWEQGEKHFRNCLLDFNEANNIAGWQWVSGCGADAAPYFRIFNPILQGERFDKKGEYVKKWVPEISELPEAFIHKPWEMEEKIKNFELGKNYPYPIVNHQKAREEALSAFQKIKK